MCIHRMTANSGSEYTVRRERGPFACKDKSYSDYISVGSMHALFTTQEAEDMISYDNNLGLRSIHV